MNLGTILRSLPRTGLASVSDHLVLGASHHDVVLLDRAVSDALGSESRAVKHQAAFDASFALLGSISNRLGIEAGGDLLELATELFATLGLGELRFELDATGGQAVGSALLVGHGQLERGAVPRAGAAPLDAFSAGFAAAAASVAFPSDWGAFQAEERSCVARGDTHCVFALSRRAVTERRAGAITRADAEQLLSPGTELDSAASPITVATRELVAGFVPNEQGVMRIGESRFAVLPAAYRAQLEFDTLHLLEKRQPLSGVARGATGAELASLFADLASESSRAGGFHLLGSLYESAALRDAFGPIPDDPGERAEQLSAIASVLGWGELTVLELMPDQRLVVSVPITPEAVYYAARHGGTPHSRLPGLRGLVEAIAWLSMLPELGREPISQATYLRLCRGDTELSTRETRSVLSGDRDSELVVELRPRR